MCEPKSLPLSARGVAQPAWDCKVPTSSMPDTLPFHQAKVIHTQKAEHLQWQNRSGGPRHVFWLQWSLSINFFWEIYLKKSKALEKYLCSLVYICLLPSLSFNFPLTAVLLLLLGVFSGSFLKKFLFKQLLWTSLMVRISINSKSPSEEDVVKAILVYYVYCLFIFTYSLCIFSLLKTHTRIYLLNKQ